MFCKTVTQHTHTTANLRREPANDPNYAAKPTSTKLQKQKHNTTAEGVPRKSDERSNVDTSAHNNFHAGANVPRVGKTSTINQERAKITRRSQSGKAR